MAAKECTNDKTFLFRNDLLWIGLRGNEQSFVQSKHCVNDA